MGRLGLVVRRSELAEGSVSVGVPELSRVSAAALRSVGCMAIAWAEWWPDVGEDEANANGGDRPREASCVHSY
jgi:hypothetical protein